MSSLNLSDRLVGKKSYNLDKLKIIVNSTPKTGNHWITYLLAAIYELPVVDLERPFDLAGAEALGPRWIGYQHYLPNSVVIDWAKHNNAIFITTLRHPGDVLVSLYHHVINFAHDVSEETSGVPYMLQRLEGTPYCRMGFFYEVANFLKDNNQGCLGGENFLSYVENSFFNDLSISLAWLRSGYSYAVRYEDLWRDPVTTLKELSSKIEEVPLDTIERAIEQCDIKMLRKVVDYDPKFFRKGEIGDWRETLSPEVIERFRTLAPYPSQFAALGYTLDSADPLITEPPKPRSFYNPFHKVTHFDNGVPISPFLVKAYLSVPSEITKEWLPVDSAEPVNSFFAWLKAPSGRDLNRNKDLPAITNLASYIHRTRFDLQKAFPDPYGQNRIDYLSWFLGHAQSECKFDRAFIEPIRKSFIEWANQSAPADLYREGKWPVITNIAAYIYNIRPDLQQAFPDIYGQNRLDYAGWLTVHGRLEHSLEKDFLLSILMSMAQG